MEENREITPRLTTLTEEVSKLYLTSTSPIAKWMWDNHVQYVANTAAQLAIRYGADEEKVVAGALLHDIADVWLPRSDEDHEEKSRAEARKLLARAGFSKAEINEIEDEIISPHSCHQKNMPPGTNGKVMAAADALGHLKTGFYVEIESQLSLFGIALGPGGYREWASKKIDRDFNAKISFPDLKEEIRPRYEELKSKYEAP